MIIYAGKDLTISSKLSEFIQKSQQNLHILSCILICNSGGNGKQPPAYDRLSILQGKEEFLVTPL